MGQGPLDKATKVRDTRDDEAGIGWYNVTSRRGWMQFALAAGVIAAVFAGNTALVLSERLNPGQLAIVFVIELALTIAGLAAFWVWLARHLFQPARRLAEDIAIIAQSNAAHRPVSDEVLHERHGLLPLAGAIDELGRELLQARRETAKAMRAAAAAADERRRRLEAILHDLTEGVVVCNLEHRIVLFNHVARAMLSAAGEVGLKRPLDLLIEASHLHGALAALQRRHAARAAEPGEPDDGISEFTCAPIGVEAPRLRARMRLIVDAGGRASGYVLSLDDVTATAEKISRREALVERLASWIGPTLQSLRAAASDQPALARQVTELEEKLARWTADYRAVAPGRAGRLPRPLPERPIFYDFDLFERLPSADVLERPLAALNWVVFDTETTGLDPGAGDEIVQIAGVRVINGQVLTGETFDRLVKPTVPIPATSTRFHGITDEMVADHPPLELVFGQFVRFVGDAALVAHNAAFDMTFLRRAADEYDMALDNPVLDTLALSLLLHPTYPDHSLDAIAARFGVVITDRHTALGDALATAEIFSRMIEALTANGIETLQKALHASEDAMKRRIRPSF